MAINLEREGVALNAAERNKRNANLTKIEDALNEVGAAVPAAEAAKLLSEEAKAQAIQAEERAAGVETQLNEIVVNGDSSVEAAQARVRSDGTVAATLKDRLDGEHQEVTAQLAETEENVNLRVDTLVIASGNANAEVTDAHVSTVKGKTFSTIRNRFEEIEEDVQSEKFIDLATYPEPVLLSVPAVGDSILGRQQTHNVAKRTISGTQFAGIVTSFTNFDVVYTAVISGAKVGTGGVVGQTLLYDKNGVEIVEGGVADSANNVNKHALTVSGAIWLMVPKGTYADIAAARSALATVELFYQLATPYQSDLKRVPSPTLNFVPAVVDAYNPKSGILTKNVQKTTLKGSNFAGLITNLTNFDAVYTIVINGAKVGTGGIVGQTVLYDKNGVEIVEGSNADAIGNVGKHSLPNTGRVWLMVPKGTYADIEAARTALGEMELTYQLETPTTHDYEAGYQVDVEEGKNFVYTTKGNFEDTMKFVNIPSTQNDVISLTLAVEVVNETEITFRDNIKWRNGMTPTFEEGKKYLLLFITYDNGITWLGSIGGVF